MIELPRLPLMVATILAASCKPAVVQQSTFAGPHGWTFQRSEAGVIKPARLGVAFRVVVERALRELTATASCTSTGVKGRHERLVKQLEAALERMERRGFGWEVESAREQFGLWIADKLMAGCGSDAENEASLTRADTAVAEVEQWVRG